MTTEDKATQLIERYVHAVGENLPSNQRDDVMEELRTLLQDALDERAREAGRPPDEELVAAVLREFGKPDKIAARYLPAQYLIGPKFYPAFLLTSKIVLTILVILLLVGWGLAVAFGRGRLAPELSLEGILQFLGGAAHSAFINVALIAAVFAVIERIQTRGWGQSKARVEEWDPRDLPRVDDAERISVVGRVWRVYCLVLLFIVLNFFPQYFGLILVSSEGVRSLPVFALGLQIPVLLLDVWWVLALALNIALLRRGRWSFATRWGEFGLGLFGALILYLTLTGSEFIADPSWFAQHGWAETAQSAKIAEKLLPLANRALRGALWVALFFTLIEEAQRLWRLSTHYRASWKSITSSMVW